MLLWLSDDWGPVPEKFFRARCAPRERKFFSATPYFVLRAAHRRSLPSLRGGGALGRGNPDTPRTFLETVHLGSIKRLGLQHPTHSFR